MAKKKSKKTKRRKKAKGGNFRRPTPAVAKTYLARREKQGIVAASDIVLEDTHRGQRKGLWHRIRTSSTIFLLRAYL